MNKPSEMTNAELAESIDAGVFCDTNLVNEISKRLRAMPEPKPDFYVGWSGSTSSGMPAKVYAIEGDRLIGAYESKVPNGKHVWVPSYWGIDGRHQGVAFSLYGDLIPNTPPEPEIWWRMKDGLRMRLYYESETSEFPSITPTIWEKVSVQVIP